MRDMWDLPRSEFEPTSPALASGFFTAEYQGSPVLEFHRPLNSHLTLGRFPL